MIRNYWMLCCLAVVGTIIFALLFVLGLVFAKKVFLARKYGVILLVFFTCSSLLLTALCSHKFILCCKDYPYVMGNTYIEEKATVIEFTYSKFDYDGSGRVENRRPKFYLLEKDEYIVLPVINVEVGETYLIRYYPNTLICEIINKIS